MRFEALDGILRVISVKIVCPDDVGRWGTEIEVELKGGRQVIIDCKSHESHLDTWRLTREFKKLSVEDRGDEYEFGRFAIHLLDDDGINTRYVESVTIVEV